MSLLPYLNRVADRENLTSSEAEEAMGIILSGEASDAQIAGFLVALRMKGETDEEVLGFARSMRARSTRVDPGLAGEPLLDIVGTGGDGHFTFNISTTAAFVIAGAGICVAKHGNRSISSRCGAADVLECLGVKLLADPELVATAIREIGIGFLFAPALHPAMRHAMTARQQLKMRTVFNILGPLTNPAGATRQLVGAPSPKTADLMAKVMASLGLARALVVHGNDGMDEITTTTTTLALEVHAGAIAHHNLSPEDFGVVRASPRDLVGGSPEENAVITRAILRGETGPKRDIVLVNAAAAIRTAGQVSSFQEGMEVAANSIDSGAARRKAEELAAFTQRY